MYVLRIKRRNECLIQTKKNVVDNGVCLLLQIADFFAVPHQLSVAGLGSFQQQIGGLGDDSHLIEKQSKKLFFPRQKSLDTSGFMRIFGTIFSVT